MHYYSNRIWRKYASLFDFNVQIEHSLCLQTSNIVSDVWWYRMRVIMKILRIIGSMDTYTCVQIAHELLSCLYVI